MKIFISILGLLCSLTTSAGSLQGVLVEVEDADTLIVTLAGTRERIQLQGLDAPEDQLNPKLRVDAKRSGLSTEALQPLGQEATAHLRSLIQTNAPLHIIADPEKRDRYGRISAEVLTDQGMSLNVLMVAGGYARPLSGSNIPDALAERLNRAWQQALTQKRGLMASQPQVFSTWLKVQK